MPPAALHTSERWTLAGMSGLTRLAAGAHHSLALRSDGTVWAWGYNLYGQLGDGSTTNRTSPVQVSGLSGIGALAGGAFFSLAATSAGSTTNLTFSYSYDRLSRLTSVSNRTSKVLGGTTSYAYTAKGTDTFAYDQPNRLTAATVAGSSETYAYDGDGVRVSRSSHPVPTPPSLGTVAPNGP